MCVCVRARARGVQCVRVCACARRAVRACVRVHACAGTREFGLDQNIFGQQFRYFFKLEPDPRFDWQLKTILSTYPAFLSNSVLKFFPLLLTLVSS